MDNFVQHGNLMLLSTRFQRLEFERIQHIRDTALLVIFVHDESRCPPLSHFHFVNVSFGIRGPHCVTIFHMWSHYAGIGFEFGLFGGGFEIALEKPKHGIGFFGGAVHVVLP